MAISVCAVFVKSPNFVKFCLEDDVVVRVDDGEDSITILVVGYLLIERLCLYSLIDVEQ
jgi:hypothetical protein